MISDFSLPPSCEVVGLPCWDRWVLVSKEDWLQTFQHQMATLCLPALERPPAHLPGIHPALPLGRGDPQWIYVWIAQLFSTLREQTLRKSMDPFPKKTQIPIKMLCSVLEGLWAYKIPFMGLRLTRHILKKKDPRWFLMLSSYQKDKIKNTHFSKSLLYA